MHMLYDSDAFAVVHILANAPVDGEAERLDGPPVSYTHLTLPTSDLV